jgi:hypothetical protein
LSFAGTLLPPDFLYEAMDGASNARGGVPDSKCVEDTGKTARDGPLIPKEHEEKYIYI